MNLQEILNTIRDNASTTYQERIPEATQNNITAIQEVMADPNQAVVANEFIGALLNMIIKQVIHNKLFSDPLKSLKKGKKPLGDTVEEIYTNFLKAKQFDSSGNELLARNLPDVKAVYHRMNRQDKYKVTISPEQLYKAFSSYDKLNSFISSIINSLYNSSELDEFILMKQLIKQAVDENGLKVVNVADPTTSSDNGKAFIKTVKTISKLMSFPSSEYNAYLDVQSTDNVPLITLSRQSEQILILDAATDVSVSVDVLASIFNMSVAEFNETRKIVIDAFPDKYIRGALVDEQFFQVFDDLVTFRDFENGEGLYRNYYLHIWQTLAYSPLVNGVVFRVASDQDTDSELETYSVTNTLKSGVKNSNKAKNVSEGNKYEGKLSGVGANDSVSVTMGGNDVTATVYNATTKKITITAVSGNIVITVAETVGVTQTLASGVTSSNDATRTIKGASYTTTLSGITTEDVTVEMDDVNITSSAYNSTNGKVTIGNVTGDIEITVA